MKGYTKEESALLFELAAWIATAPRDCVMIMLGMMLRDTGRADINE